MYVYDPEFLAAINETFPGGRWPVEPGEEPVIDELAELALVDFDDNGEDED